MNSDDQLVVLDGSSFFVAGRDGDCPPGQETGFFYQDVRHLSVWRLRVDGQPVRLLTSRNDAYYSARVFGTLASAGWVTTRRCRSAATGWSQTGCMRTSSWRTTAPTAARSPWSWRWPPTFCASSSSWRRMSAGGPAST